MQTGFPNSGKTLVLEIDVVPASIDPLQIADFAGRFVTAFTSRTLFRSAEWGRPVKEGILRRAEPRDGGLIWRLFADETAIWSNGRGLTLADINDGLVRSCTRASGPLGWLGALIAKSSRVGSDALDVELTRPVACFPEMLTSDIFSPVAERPEAVTGCYNFVGGLGGRALVLCKNEVGDRLWADGPDEVIFVVTDSPEQGVRLFERRAVDVTCNPNLPLRDLARYRGSASLRQRDLQLGGVLLFASELLRGADARDARRAIARAIPRRMIAEALAGSLSPLCSMSALWNAPEAVATAADPDDVRPAQITTDLGCLVLGYADFHPNRTVADHIAEGLRSRAGLRVETRALDYRSYLACLARPTVDLLYSLVQPAYPDPTSFLANLRASGWIDLQRADFGAALAEAEQSFDREDRLAACCRAERIMQEETPLVPIARAVSKCLVSEQAAALELGPDGIFRPPLVREGAMS